MGKATGKEGVLRECGVVLFPSVQEKVVSWLNPDSGNVGLTELRCVLRTCMKLVLFQSGKSWILFEWPTTVMDE